MTKSNWWSTSYAVSMVFIAMAIASRAQTFTTLHSFKGVDGDYPAATLIQATDGSLYGTTLSGGSSTACTDGCGTIFKITPSGTLTRLYSFCSQTGCGDGIGPVGALLQATDGNLYGTTRNGGANYGGTVFRVTPSGILTTLYSFCINISCTDGDAPYAALVQATDGSFYGTTSLGGAYGYGTIFKIAPSGLTTLHSFDWTDGANPYAPLVQASDGDFYGTTVNGSGFYGAGSIFKISLGGTLTTLHSFCSQRRCADGALPYAPLLAASDGNFYGTTTTDGAHEAGTVFKITASGDLTTLHSFALTEDGQNPYAGLIEATDGNFYGTIFGGGSGTSCSDGCGAVFIITPQGTLTTLHDFDGADGGNPYGGLVQDTNGILYGVTEEGGANGDGTVFSLSVGLGPFVKTLPTGGKVGGSIKILGTNLTGATSVTFNGTPATFTVEAPSVIKTAVPAGATTGTVQVATPSGTLSSNVPFRVAP
jgi:uncharacterized repeat protein (TIGR03803 family)